MQLTVYLAGEIHSQWRDEIKEKSQSLKLPVTFVGPMEKHDRSDNIGEDILGEQPNAIFKDDAASDLNNFRTEIKQMSSLHALVRNINSGTQPWMHLLRLQKGNLLF